MRSRLVSALTGGLLVTAMGAWASEPKISGEYLETRTANVYVGACHANGEMVTVGREAMLVWNVRTGVSNGIRLDGVNAMAVVTGSDNLGFANTSRKSVLYIDSAATAEQAAALVSTLKSNYTEALGNVISVKRAKVAFAKSGLEYSVEVPSVASIKTTRYACDHCVMPHMIWYQPFVNLKSSLVGLATLNEFKGTKELPTSWRLSGDNSSYVGEFAL